MYAHMYDEWISCDNNDNDNNNEQSSNQDIEAILTLGNRRRV